MSEIRKERILDPSVIPPLDESILSLSETELEFLHQHVTKDDVELKRRILEVQKEAYAQHAYPCIRGFHFVNLMMAANPVYPRVLEAGKTGKTVLLDLGCCMGSDVRKLVSDGYTASNVLGCDLRQEFLDLGRKLYGSDNGIRFFTSDIFETPYPFTKDAPLDNTLLAEVTDISQLRGRITHFYTGALFHLFDEATQYALALRVASLLKREPGAVVFGRHQGLPEHGMIDDHLGRSRYGHSPTSWPLLWKKVFSEIESPDFANNVVVEAELTGGFAPAVLGAKGQTNMLYWSVRLV